MNGWLLAGGMSTYLGEISLSLPLAWAAIELIRNNMPARIARFVVGWDQIDVDPRILAFTGVVALVTTLAFGLLPALAASRLNLTATLNEGGRGSSGAERQRGRSAMVVAEVAIALMLLVASGLSIRGTVRMLDAYQGYDPDSLLTMDIQLPEKGYEEESKRRQFYRDVLAGVRQLPRMASTDVINTLPSSGNNPTRAIEIECQPVQNNVDLPRAHYRVASSGIFETLRIPLLSGRSFGLQDREDSLAVAIVSKKMAERNWPDTPALGKRFKIAGQEDVPWLMRQRLSERMIGLKYAATMMGVFSTIALVLSAVGIYGVLAYSVSRLTHEIGVRVALGAGRGDVLRLTLGRVFRLTLLGLALGLVLAFGAGKLMANNLFGTVSLDATTYVAFTLVLTAVCLIAGLLPARRALAVNPAGALRVE